MEVIRDLKALVPVLARDIEAARTLASPNPEDDLAIRAAIVGFSYNSPTEQWGRDHYLFVRRRLDEEYKLHDLEFYGENRANVRLFFALCAGYLMGMYEANKIDDNDFRLAEMQLPGLIALCSPGLTEKPV